MAYSNCLPRKHAVRHRAPFFLYLGAVFAIAGSIAYFGWTRTWTSVFVPAMYPPFADMRLIQGAVISVAHGLNPQISNPGDRWGRLFDYPMLWVAIGKALNFTDESHFILICTALVLSFVGVCALLLFRFPSFGLLASLVSTTTLWGIERGNTDLVMFCLLFPVALWIPKLWSPVPPPAWAFRGPPETTSRLILRRFLRACSTKGMAPFR